jgi:outer membrane protein assembly factor BamD
MSSRKRYYLWLLILLVFCGIEGCSLFFSSQPLDQQPLNNLLQEGLDASRRGDFDKAIEIFQHIKDAHPFSSEAIVAQLKLADAYYYKRDFENAILCYEDFISLHPKHKAVPYALYQIGLCYFHQIPTIDRDQTMTRKALEIFKQLIKEYPSTRYAKRALLKIKTCREKLAAHEFYVGRFYYRTGAYKSALLRFRYIVEHYADLPIARKAQHYLELSKSKLEKKLSETPACPLS